MMNDTSELKELHWLMSILHNIDVGLFVINREYSIQMWNGFMENHSGLSEHRVYNKSIFDVFPELPKEWFKHKINSVFMLKNHAFSIWEQRPFLFKFKTYRPITGCQDYMYQNATLMPLTSVDGEVHNICIVLYDVTEIASSKQKLIEANLKLESMSRTDALTQLYNRGYWEECFEKEFRRCNRYDHQCTLIIFDIDHFKKINDTFGHQAGDKVICRVAELSQRMLRNSDVCGRYGGEEFVVFLPNTQLDSAEVLAERIRKRIEEQVILHEEEEIRFTVSLGVSELREEMETYEQWIAAADKALYQSKEQGRNRITLAD